MTISFATEEQLVAQISTLFGQSTSTQWKWLREFSSPSGIADLVAVALDKHWQHQSPIRRIPVRWLYPLKCLPMDTRVDVESFATRFGVSESCAQTVLAAFTDASYCVYDRAGRVWMKTKDPSPIAARIIALEAKLRDWRRALYQAVQYSAYASEAWVVLDENSLHSASTHVDEFEKRGIGLMSLSANGDSDIISQAVSRPPRSHERFWRANAEIARLVFT